MGRFSDPVPYKSGRFIDSCSDQINSRIKRQEAAKKLALACLWKPKCPWNYYEDSIGSFYFNLSHLYDVIQERRKRGKTYEKEDLTNTHPLGDKMLLVMIPTSAGQDQRWLKVVKVTKNWDWGYYIVIVAENDSGSSFVILWENLSVFDKVMAKKISESRSRVILIKDPDTGKEASP